ncbi:hypothetical protein RFI_15949 [Reticulomyxa filosa]|uniref:Uncharacterized protein n=1 Tax=Reticulomyxa filosa TaxID=46433 RepID=X6N5P6_RETFI|nr:hypothetical protein RFI_15949 [Reticulomyxa filosa]|eukprot:ETO21253.1 hypothetical protein RFI_15949 [Reticulomyxa filosa]
MTEEFETNEIEPLATLKNNLKGDNSTGVDKMTETNCKAETNEHYVPTATIPQTPSPSRSHSHPHFHSHVQRQPKEESKMQATDSNNENLRRDIEENVIDSCKKNKSANDGISVNVQNNIISNEYISNVQAAHLLTPNPKEHTETKINETPQREEKVHKEKKFFYDATQ